MPVCRDELFDRRGNGDRPDRIEGLTVERFDSASSRYDDHAETVDGGAVTLGVAFLSPPTAVVIGRLAPSRNKAPSRVA